MSFSVDDFVWHEWVIEKIITKHRVEPWEVEEAFFNRPFEVLSGGEGKFKLLGRTDAGRYPLVVFVLEGRSARIITARDMGNTERRYFKGK